VDGHAMDCNRHVGGQEELPPLEGPQATSDSAGRVAAASANQWRLLHQFQQAPGLSACFSYRFCAAKEVAAPVRCCMLSNSSAAKLLKQSAADTEAWKCR
jgi:hypothetical protein